MSHTHIPILKTTKNGELGTQLFKNLKDVWKIIQSDTNTMLKNKVLLKP
jgi:hypothetical protein